MSFVYLSLIGSLCYFLQWAKKRVCGLQWVVRWTRTWKVSPSSKIVLRYNCCKGICSVSGKWEVFGHEFPTVFYERTWKKQQLWVILCPKAGQTEKEKFPILNFAEMRESKEQDLRGRFERLQHLHVWALHKTLFCFPAKYDAAHGERLSMIKDTLAELDKCNGEHQQAVIEIKMSHPDLEIPQLYQETFLDED